MQNTSNIITAAETAAGKTRAQIEAARADFLTLSPEQRDGYQYFYAEQLGHKIEHLLGKESTWIHNHVWQTLLPNDGVMVPINTARALVKNTRLVVVDTSGGSSYGYSYGVKLFDERRVLIASITVDTPPRGFRAVFSLSHLEAIIAAVAAIQNDVPEFVYLPAL